MKIIIIDPGFVTDRGHHFPMNDFISHEAKIKGYKPIVLGPEKYAYCIKNKLCRKPNFPARFIFPVHSYMHPFDRRKPEGNSIMLNMSVFGNHNKLTEIALQKNIPTDRLKDGDTILLHTTFLNSMLGIASWLRSPNTPKLKIRVVLRFPPWFYQISRDVSEILFREALRLWEQINGDVIFFTDVQAYTEYVQERTSIPVLTTPIGLDLNTKTPITPPKGDAKKGFVFVAAGIPHEAKGSELLPPAITEYLKCFPQDRFIVQGRVLHHFEGFRENDQDKAIFSHPNVQLLRKTLDTEAFHELLKTGDILLNPYCPIDYHFRTSHIFMEGLGLNRVVIGANLDWTQEWMEKLGNVGALLEDHSVEALIDAMCSVRENIEEHRAAVLKITDRIRNENNAHNWLNFVLNPPNT